MSTLQEARGRKTHHCITEKARVPYVNVRDMPKDLHQRFWMFVRRATIKECWEWLGGKRDGYGMFGFEGKTKIAHRVSYELFRGSIP